MVVLALRVWQVPTAARAPPRLWHTVRPGCRSSLWHWRRLCSTAREGRRVSVGCVLTRGSGRDGRKKWVRRMAFPETQTGLRWATMAECVTSRERQARELTIHPLGGAGEEVVGSQAMFGALGFFRCPAMSHGSGQGRTRERARARDMDAVFGVAMAVPAETGLRFTGVGRLTERCVQGHCCRSNVRQSECSSIRRSQACDCSGRWWPDASDSRCTLTSDSQGVETLSPGWGRNAPLCQPLTMQLRRQLHAVLQSRKHLAV